MPAVNAAPLVEEVRRVPALGGGAVATTIVMINMAVYGAMAGTTSGGAAVAIERSPGWSRQLRLPSENVMQFVGPMLAIMAMFGGIFIPLKGLPPTLRTIAQFTPTYGVGQLARAPFSGDAIGIPLLAVLGWTLCFGISAMLLFHRDTHRVQRSAITAFDCLTSRPNLSMCCSCHSATFFIGPASNGVHRWPKRSLIVTATRARHAPLHVPPGRMTWNGSNKPLTFRAKIDCASGASNGATPDRNSYSAHENAKRSGCSSRRTSPRPCSGLMNVDEPTTNPVAVRRVVPLCVRFVSSLRSS